MSSFIVSLTPLECLVAGKGVEFWSLASRINSTLHIMGCNKETLVNSMCQPLVWEAKSMSSLSPLPLGFKILLNSLLPYRVLPSQGCWAWGPRALVVFWFVVRMSMGMSLTTNRLCPAMPNSCALGFNHFKYSVQLRPHNPNKSCFSTPDTEKARPSPLVDSPGQLGFLFRSIWLLLSVVGYCQNLSGPSPGRALDWLPSFQHLLISLLCAGGTSWHCSQAGSELTHGEVRNPSKGAQGTRGTYPVKVASPQSSQIIKRPPLREPRWWCS